MRLLDAAIPAGQGKNRRVESHFDSVFQVLLVVLDRKNIVAAAFDDLRRDRFLTEDRVAGDDLAF